MTKQKKPKKPTRAERIRKLKGAAMLAAEHWRDCFTEYRLSGEDPTAYSFELNLLNALEKLRAAKARAGK